MNIIALFVFVLITSATPTQSYLVMSQFNDNDHSWISRMAIRSGFSSTFLKLARESAPLASEKWTSHEIDEDGIYLNRVIRGNLSFSVVTKGKEMNVHDGMTLTSELETAVKREARKAGVNLWTVNRDLHLESGIDDYTQFTTKLSEVQGKADEVTAIAKQNIEKLIAQQANLQLLEEKSADLELSANQFRNRIKKYNSCWSRTKRFFTF